MITKAKKEISHEILDKRTGSVSARHNFKIGDSFKSMDSNMKLVLVDKVIYPIDECPHCGSEATYHARMGEHGLYCSNVWDHKYWGDPVMGGASASAKFDYCLDCHKEFLIELYILKERIVKEKKHKKKKNWFIRIFNTLYFYWQEGCRVSGFK